MKVLLAIPKILRKLLEAINKFSNMAGYKISLYSSTAFLYTINKHTKEVMNTSASNNKPNQGIKGLYNENFKP